MKFKNKQTIAAIQKLKKNATPFTAITAYDFPTALIINQLDIPMVLVGDSASMVVYGYDNTTAITMDELLLITKAVVRGIQTALVIGDMPFMSYQPSDEQAVLNAGRFIKEGKVDAVKLEGGVEYIKRIKAIIRSGVPVMGHIGLQPQSILQESGYKIQGKDFKSALKIYNDAIELEKAGVFALVLEGVPQDLAKIISEKIRIPTIGIGAGISCDGQIQVVHDVLGLFKSKVPKHAHKYIDSYNMLSKALKHYNKDVTNKKFPGSEHSIKMNELEFQKLKNYIENN